MPKSKLSKLDLKRVSLELNASLAGRFVNNVYDVDNKTFLLKLTAPQKEKETVVIESGVRIHSTKFVKEKADMPSGFSMKLRKHVRNKRLIAIRQLGDDRVVEMVFGFQEPESHFHLIIEFYAAGNVILTDHRYKVLSLIRVFKDDETRFAVGEDYMKAIGKSQDALGEGIQGTTLNRGNVEAFLQTLLIGDVVEDGKKKGQPALKQALSNRTSPSNNLGPDLIEHCILLSGVDPGEKLNNNLVQNQDGKLQRVVDSLVFNAKEFLDKLVDLNVHAGFLILEQRKKGKELDEEEEEMPMFYDRFEAFLLEQHKGRDYIEKESLNAAVDEFFSKIELQRQQKAREAHHKAAAKKVEAIKTDQENRIKTLEKQISDKEHCAEAITFNTDSVETAILVMRSAVASGMSWEDIEEYVEAEKAKGNPVALMITSLKLEQNMISLKLPTPDGQALVNVDVDINISAFANATEKYQNKKDAVLKAEKTLEATAKVLEKAEEKFHKVLEKHDVNKIKVRVQRKINWFEKFRWFITSEGYLVLAGRDAQQNQLLVSKYLRKDFGDRYVHADVHGAATCIVRAHSPKVPIPSESLDQAGAFSVCVSKAWPSKIISAAYWVDADQVSRTAPSGEYLSAGGFMIRGKRNFLTPSRLELVFGFIFKLDETQKSFDNRQLEWRALQSSDSERDFEESDDEKGEEVEHQRDDLEKDEDVKESMGENHEDREEELDNVDLDNVDLDNENEERGEEDEDVEIEEEEEDETDGVGKDEIEKNLVKEKQKPLRRRQRNKLKKIKNKYREQTEEDRRLAMLALGHKLDEEGNVIDPKIKKGESETAKQGSQEALPKRKKGHPNALRNLDDETKANDELNLRGFTMHPKQGDVLLYALPVLCPPRAASKFKFRIKLIPGTLKKGKASAAALESLLRQPDATDLEKELLRNVTDAELTNAMASGVKLMGSGMSQGTKKGAKKKKKGNNAQERARKVKSKLQQK